MRKSKHLINLPVISLQEGQRIGKVKGLVVDPSRKSVAALILEEKGLFKEQKFIPFCNVRSVGENAVTVEQGNIIQKGATLPEIVKYYKDKIDVIGSRIVMENGTIIGQVNEYFIETQDGKIAGLEISTGIINDLMEGKAYLNSDFIRTLGKQVTVCTDDSKTNLIKNDDGMQENIRSFAGKAGQTWSLTLEKSRRLGSAIGRPFKERFKRLDKTSAIIDEKDELIPADSTVEETESKKGD
ncbi:MAG TPA: photosystem reaction center subunit H [Desulfotomaculum sp.]|nr:MAG: hypothetical protein XD84_0941 [Desulfotomaculum sp. 46_80]HAG10388.1 photosystem reaction center subunit H [Desulfotomaculum sp.]HBY04177.1 photosystem reaction center subunit H [Desulfotomaculum sp.]